VIVGHLDSIRGAAIFYDLKQIKTGDEVRVERDDGSAAVFKVDSLEMYSQDNFPTEKVYGPINFAGLRLITCAGTFSRLKGHYSDNLVVYASLVSKD
jgi:sortase (surface protein transpeptidase)